MSFRGFLDILFIFHIAYFTRAILYFILKEEGIELTSQAYSESRFKEKEYQANQADDACNRAIGIYKDEKDEHGPCQDHADYPGELLLSGPDIFRGLVPDNQTCQGSGLAKIWG